jgi:hypothetical protein
MPCRAPPYHITTISKSSAIVRRHPAALMCFADGLRIAPEWPRYNRNANIFHNLERSVDKMPAKVVYGGAARPTQASHRHYGNADKRVSQGGGGRSFLAAEFFGKCGSRYRVMKSGYASTVLNKARGETSAPPRHCVNVAFRRARLCLPQADAERKASGRRQSYRRCPPSPTGVVQRSLDSLAVLIHPACGFGRRV